MRARVSAIVLPALAPALTALLWRHALKGEKNHSCCRHRGRRVLCLRPLAIEQAGRGMLLDHSKTAPLADTSAYDYI